MSASWSYGPFVLGCGTFGGIGGSAALIGRGLDEPAAFAAMDEAIALGIALFDTAERYAGGASEEMIGRWLADREPGVSDRVLVATKVAPPDVDGPGGRFDGAFLGGKFAGSLQRLGLDAVEILFTHAPDDLTPIEETLEGLEAIRVSGRCRHLGACNVDADQLVDGLDAAERLGIEGYRVVQNGYSLMQPAADDAVRVICVERDVAYTAFSPLAGGALTGKYERGAAPPPDSRLALRPEGTDELLTPAVFGAIDRLRLEATEQHEVTCGALALAWLTHHPHVAAAVTGPSRTAPHLALAREAIGVDLSGEEIDLIRTWFTDAA